jgi:hypothetical protein
MRFLETSPYYVWIVYYVLELRALQACMSNVVHVEFYYKTAGIKVLIII